MTGLAIAALVTGAMSALAAHRAMSRQGYATHTQRFMFSGGVSGFVWGLSNLVWLAFA